MNRRLTQGQLVVASAAAIRTSHQWHKGTAPDKSDECLNFAAERRPLLTINTVFFFQKHHIYNQVFTNMRQPSNWCQVICQSSGKGRSHKTGTSFATIRLRVRTRRDLLHNTCKTCSIFVIDHSKQSLCNEQDTCHSHFLSTARMHLSTPLGGLRWRCHGVATRHVSPRVHKNKIHKNKSMPDLFTTGHWHDEISSDVPFVQKGVSMWHGSNARQTADSCQELTDAKPKSICHAFPFFFSSQKLSQRVHKGKKVRLFKDRHPQSTRGASMARKRTRLGRRVLRHQLAQVFASSGIMTCFSCAAIVFWYSKRARTFFTLNGPLEVTLLEIRPCQTPMCGVAYSCSYDSW